MNGTGNSPNERLAVGNGRETFAHSLWLWFYREYGGGDDFFLWTAFFVVTFVYFWSFNIFFMLVELTGRPTSILQYRIQLKHKPPVVDHQLFFKCMRGVLFNQLVIGMPFHYAMLPVFQWRGCFNADLPAFPRLVFDLVVSALALELGFYYTHRMLHLPFWYSRVHKVHHEWKTPISISAIYCHPFEYFVSNLLPLVAGPILLGSHLLTALLWVMISSGSGCIAHCGFHLPFMPSNETHDFHHSHSSDCQSHSAERCEQQARA